jgi:hypothetical protein
MLFSHKKNEDQRHATTWMTFENLRPKIKRFKFGIDLNILYYKGNANQTTLRFYLDPVTFVIIIKTKRNAGKDRERKSKSHTLLVGM